MTTKQVGENAATDNGSREGRVSASNSRPRRVRELSDKLPFSSRITPSHRQMLLDLEQRTKVKQVALLEEALNLLAQKHKYTF